MKLAGLDAHHVRPAQPVGPPLLLVHGIGLGRWFWKRDQELLASLGLESWAVDLPGHGAAAGKATMDHCYDAVEAAAACLEEPALVGHSAGGLVAQVVASRTAVRSLVLVASVPCAPVPFLPTPQGVRCMLPQLGRLAAGRNLPLRRIDYVRTGMHLLSEDEVDRAVAQLSPWPNGMVRDMAFRRPRLEGWGGPVLVTHGLLDRVSSLRTSRLLADHHDAVLWRFDDLAHLPPLEPGGERHARAVGEWLLQPTVRQVREIDPLAPTEGVGDGRRAERRGWNPPRSDSGFGDRRKS